MNEYLTGPFFDKVMSGDFTAELSMPDYEVPLRRLLRVSLSLTPPRPEQSGGKIGMSGEMELCILYSGNDGMLYSTAAKAEYKLLEALTQKESKDIAALICEAVPESLTSRVLAPRKLSFRCRIRGRARGFCSEDAGERLTYIENPESVMRLEESHQCTVFYPMQNSSFELNEEIGTEENGDVRIICSEAAAVCENAECGRDSCAVRGSVYLSLLMKKEDSDEPPYRVTKRLPFSEVVDADGVDSGCECLCRLSVSELRTSIDDGRLYAEMMVHCSVSPHKNIEGVYTSDLYSTEVNSNITKKHFTTPDSCRLVSSDFSENIYEPLESLGLEGEPVIIDSLVSTSDAALFCEDGKWVAEGSLNVSLMLAAEDDYTQKELKLPFRHGLDIDCRDVCLSELTVIPTSHKIKAEGGRLSVYCELLMRGRVCGTSGFDAVDEAVFSEPVEKDSDLTVCFPSPTDTLWDVAKKYHTTTEAIQAKNSPNTKYKIV